MKAIATEIILTIGVLIAVGITAFQLRGIYIAQQQLGEEEVILSFIKDLESIVDRAIGTTGDAAFIYYPIIEKYRVEIENNVVKALDKISGKQASFSKLAPEIVENSFEDCEKIFVLKKGRKIALMCRCLDLGEYCTDSILCCSGYCNHTSLKCEEMPICSEDRICPGAPEAKKDSLGRDCCPSEAPICTNGHCCPVDKPKWCEKPKDGSAPRCMDKVEYDNNCKRGFPIIYIPLNYKEDEFNLFKSGAERNFFDYVTKYAPSKECRNPYSVFQPYYLDPSKCTIKCSNPCEDCLSVTFNCFINNYQEVINDANDWMVIGICKDFSCTAGGKWCGCSVLFSRFSVDNIGCGSDSAAHEMGHSVGFNHVDGICDNPAGACQGINAGDCNDPKKYEDLMTYCRTRFRYGNIAYEYLKNTIFKDYLVGC